MAVALSEKSQKVFFQSVFGNDWTEANISPLIAAGVELKVQFVDIVAVNKSGEKHTLALTQNTTALMKFGNTTEAEMAKNKIRYFIGTLWTKFLHKAAPGYDPVAHAQSIAQEAAAASTPNVEKVHVMSSMIDPSKLDLDLSSESLKSALSKLSLSQIDPVTSTMQAVTQPAVTIQTPPKPVKLKSQVTPMAGVVKLRDAKAVGQKVYGTSSGSVYVAIALNDRVKVAARIQGPALSLRVEHNNATSKELAALDNSGLQKKDEDYYSAHFKTGEIPPARIIGSFLFDSGIEFDSQVQSMKEIEGLQ